MDQLHKKAMSLAGVLEFRRHHEVSLDDNGLMVAQTRIAVVFSGLLNRDSCREIALMALSEPVAAGFLRMSHGWDEPDLYGKPSFVVHFTDVEQAGYGTSRSQAS